jgi:DNA (cytosine-5)-methyltransferase 1
MLLRTVGLFAGIGGIELGLASAGHRITRLCEIDPLARCVLEKRFPGVFIDADIRALERFPMGTDLITAGFPCQDLSQVGTRCGLNGKHSILVQHVFKLLKKKPVPWVLLENVPFMLHLDKGKTIRKIVSQLERLGYSWAYRIVDTRAFGLPQRRRRVFLLASLDSDPRNVLLADDGGHFDEPCVRNGGACGFYWTEGNTGIGWAIDAIPPLKGGSLLGIPSPPGIVLPSGRISTPDIRDGERLQGFKPNWTLPAARLNNGRNSIRWKLIGNAVSVHVARWIGRRLRSPLCYDDSSDVEFQRKCPWPNAAWSVGEGRFVANVSEWPAHYKYKPLAQFLRYDPKLLSQRAAHGFLKRALASNLKIDKQFISELRKHVSYMDRYGKAK